ncbi:MAG TPA: DUF4398 domain-containing protein [Polyangiaceae bacterium]|nr:DUF4398 domain-containing protein [Polyangiaceae bacterium]
MTRRVFSAPWILSFLLLACGGAPLPQEQFSAAQASVKGAEVAGAAEDPKSALHLKLAHEQLDKAKALMDNGDNERAAHVIDRAQADAELAILLAKEARARKEATDAREQVEELKQRIQK